MLTILDPADVDARFPPLETALREPNGLLAIGGDLSSERLLNAYRHGIFPWYNQGQPILWWSPDPRMVLFPGKLKTSRSLKKSLRTRGFEYSLDQAFDEVIEQCAAPRQGETGTWISLEMQLAYKNLHRLGHAHSVEVWQNDLLVGGLYGIAIGKVFFGESMFSRVTDASKAAFYLLDCLLQQQDFCLVDCQVYSEHLSSLGAEEIDRQDFAQHLAKCCALESSMQWQQARQPLAAFCP
ncbi:MAG: leucyl/phenylalanyl-tRNA--protein transferase [Chromatiales bacterium]|jgi:leucyl/phenylalanyl-tRNA--protein transferase